MINQNTNIKEEVTNWIKPRTVITIYDFNPEKSSASSSMYDFYFDKLLVNEAIIIILINNANMVEKSLKKANLPAVKWNGCLFNQLI